MPLTKAERAKLRSFRKRADKVAKDAKMLGRDVGRELVKQSAKS